MHRERRMVVKKCTQKKATKGFKKEKLESPRKRHTHKKKGERKLWLPR